MPRPGHEGPLLIDETTEEAGTAERLGSGPLAVASEQEKKTFGTGRLRLTRPQPPHYPVFCRSTIRK
jgi:hypothetical protein